MSVVPRWYCVLAHALAVGFCVWLGLHIYAPVEWIAIFGVVVILTALLPVSRVMGFVGIAGGILIAGVGTYLLRDVWKAISVDQIVSFQSGPLVPAREAIVLAFASLWLVAGSVFRTQRA
ncbi:MAG: hypothetical protein QM831_14285 [Kofleriaceae bacterium]